MRRTSRIWLLAILASCLLCLVSPAALADGEEGETVEEIQDKIREKEKEAEKEAEEAQEKDQYSGCSLLGDIFGAMARSGPATSGDDYYEPRYFDQVVRREVPPGYSQWGYFGLELDGAYLLQNRWSTAGRLTLNTRQFHFHAFTQFLFDPTDFIVCYAANAGPTFSARWLIVNLFGGAFGTNLTSRALLSFGAEARVFLSWHCVLELYSLNAMFYSLQFNFLSLALLYDANRVSLGAGFNLNNYAGSLLLGPSVRLSFRL